MAGVPGQGQLPRENLFTCPHCGSHDLIRRGIYRKADAEPESNWSCRDCGKYTIESRLLANLLEDQDQDLQLTVQSVRELSRAPRYFISSILNNTPLHAPFWENVLHYCEVNDCELILKPTRYRNPTSQFMHLEDQTEIWWPEAAYPYLVQQEIELHELLLYMGHVPIAATSKNPLSGLEGLSRNCSAIFGHSQLQNASIATPQNALPKQIYTSGSCSVAAEAYSESKAGIQGKFHHTLGGIVVEKEADRFHLRPIVAGDDGSFCDLAWHYRDGTDARAKPMAAIKIADEHIRWDEPGFDNAVYFAPDSQMAVFRPKIICRDDTHDSYSISHHHQKNAVTKYGKRMAGMDDLRAELELAADYVARTTPETPDGEEPVLNLFATSNHHEHVFKWLVECGDPRQDPTNLLLWCEMMGAVLRDTKMGQHGVEHPDPFALWMEPELESRGVKAKFLGPNDSFQVMGWELGSHGHYGPGGSRGGLKSFIKTGAKWIIGHIHGGGIEKNTWAAGARISTAEYKKGPDNWMKTNVGIWAETGKPQHWHVVDGYWHGNPRLAELLGTRAPLKVKKMKKAA